ncbi:hypothetical protein DRO54_09370, partial [Candidatus Bathyarchaeota archaeon]
MTAYQKIYSFYDTIDYCRAMKRIAFIHEMFRKYYQNEASSMLMEPPKIERREFGFIMFGGGMLRHKSFKSRDELVTFMRDFAPSDAYYSCAYY